MDAATEVMTSIHRWAGAEDTVTIKRYAHLVGGCRMVADERSGVVDRNLGSFAVDNLFVTDGSVLPTQGSANPALTIMALAARCADHLTAGQPGVSRLVARGRPVTGRALAREPVTFPGG